MKSLVVFVIFLAAPDAKEIQEQAIRSRTAIVTGEIEYEVSLRKDSDKPDAPLEWDAPVFRDRLVFDNRSEWFAFLERWRPNEIVALVNGEALVQKNPAGGHLERIVIRPDVAYKVLPDRLSNGAKMAISESRTSDQPNVLAEVFHPWKFGMLPKLIDEYRHFSMDAFVAPSMQTETLVTLDELEGNSCWRVEYRREDGALVKTWFDIERGMNVRKVSFEGSHELGTFLISATSELKCDESTGIWFPAEIERSGYLNGKFNSGTNERIVVTKARFNIEPEPDQFTVKALGAIPHTTISPTYNKPGLSEKWDGENVVHIRSTSSAHPLPSKSVSYQYRLFVLANLFAMIGLAVWFLPRRL